MALPGTAYSNLGVVFALVRSLVNDAAGNWATDAVLLPYANAAHRTVDSELGNVQATSYIKDNVLFTLPAIAGADSTVQTVLNDAGYNNGTTNFTQYAGKVLQLPTDLLSPLVLWERTPSSSEEFEEMEDTTDGGGLPPILQGQRLRYWEFRTDGIYFLGCTQDEQIRLRYEAAFLDMADGTNPLLIRRGENAIAYKTVMLVGSARGAAVVPTVMATVKDLYDTEIEILKNRAALQAQYTGVRRRRYSRTNSGRIIV